MRLAITDLDTGAEYWTATQCAQHINVTRHTWSAYISREQAPASVGNFGKSPVWSAKEVKEWHAARAGRK